MNDFFIHYGVCIILCVIGAFFVTVTYISMFTKPSGVPFVGGILIAIGFLTTPVKWLALLGFVDPGWFMLISFFRDNLRWKKKKKEFEEIIEFGYLTNDNLPDELKAINSGELDSTTKMYVHIPELEEKLEWHYRINQVYELKHPHMFFAICVNKNGHRYVLIDKMSEHIEAMTFDLKSISIKELKDANKEMTVTLEVLENN